MADLRIDLSAEAQTSGLWQVQGPSPVVNTSAPDATDAVTQTTFDVSSAGFTDLSTTAMLAFATMPSEARLSAALLKRALDAYTANRDDAAQYLQSESTAQALQPLLMFLRRPGL